MDEPVRCIVVGLGGVTGGMLQAFTTFPWFSIAGVVDIRSEALEKAREDWRLPADALFTSLDAAIARRGANAVMINTPSQLHFTQTRQALEHGLHALVAKPVTNDFDEAVALVDLARERGVTLAIGQQMRFRRHYQAVAAFVRGGALGAPEVVNFVNTKPRPLALNLANMAQPALYEMSCHHFDCLLAALPGHLPETIVCDGFRPSWSPYAGPCMVNALIRFSEGLHVLYQGGFSSLASNYEFRIEGTKGVLRCRGIHMSNDQMDYEFAPAGGAFAPVDLESGLPNENPWLVLGRHWRNQLLGREDPPFSGQNNLLPFALLSAGVDSVNSGLSVDLRREPRYAPAFTANGSLSHHV